MMSIDTNVVVRYLVGNDPGQLARVNRLIRENAIYVALTVLLETEWVLRDRYEISRRNFVHLPTVVLEDAPRALRALGWAEAGMDFADALHLASSPEGAGFASIDRKLAKVAACLGAPEIRAP